MSNEMNNEDAIRKLIRGSKQRAIQESVAALIVFIAFGAILPRQVAGSIGYYGGLLILVGIGVIVGVVWWHALSERLLREHPASDTGFWREEFRAQARMLRWVPLWYCAPLGVGGLLFIAPKSAAAFAEERIPFLIAAGIFSLVFAGVIWLNRRAAAYLDAAAKQLTDGPPPGP